jgi:hypothetical protein
VAGLLRAEVVADGRLADPNEELWGIIQSRTR